MKLRLLVYISFFIGSLTFSSCQSGGSGNTLSNGYKYTLHTSNEGPRPAIGEVVSLDFQLIDEAGKILDDSRLINTSTPSIKVPEENDAATARNPMLALIRKMTIGDSATVIVPTDSLPNPPEDIKASKFISYVVKVNAIEDAEAYRERINKEQLEIRAAAKFKEEAMKDEIKGYFDNYLAGKYKSSTVTNDNGLKVAIINDKNDIIAKSGDFVSVQYFGFLKDGSSFDNSYRAGRPFTFKIGQGMAIKGWDLGIPQVPRGADAILEIPYELAYGEKGNPPVIPAKSDLYFFINVESINNQ